MRRQGQDEVAAAARRRLELLSRELAQGGLAPREEEDLSLVADPVTGELPPSVVLPHPAGGLADALALPDPGRHARSRAPVAWARLGGWLTDRLPPTLQGRIGLGSAQVALVAIVVAAGLALAAVVVLRSGGGGQVVPLAAPASGAGTPLAGAAPAKPVTSSSGAPVASKAVAGGAPVVVDVAGKVRRPGVATLPAGSRVIDALRKAGGARPGVSLASLNLARVLVDGEQILVGVTPPPGAAASAASSPGAPPAAGQLVNLNSATEEQLDSLPGVGPVTAQKILDWRAKNGAFSSVDELLEVDGIGDKTLADLAPFLTL